MELCFKGPFLKPRKLLIFENGFILFDIFQGPGSKQDDGERDRCLLDDSQEIGRSFQ